MSELSPSCTALARASIVPGSKPCHRWWRPILASAAKLEIHNRVIPTQYPGGESGRHQWSESVAGAGVWHTPNVVYPLCAFLHCKPTAYSAVPGVWYTQAEHLLQVKIARFETVSGEHDFHKLVQGCLICSSDHASVHALCTYPASAHTSWNSSRD